MAIMEISVVPVGTEDSSISGYVACSEDVLKRSKGIKWQVTAMGTIVESDSLDELFSIARKMHEEAMLCGVKRVFTDISIDDRRDKQMSMEAKVESVMKKINR